VAPRLSRQDRSRRSSFALRHRPAWCVQITFRVAASWHARDFPERCSEPARDGGCAANWMRCRSESRPHVGEDMCASMRLASRIGFTHPTWVLDAPSSPISSITGLKGPSPTLHQGFAIFSTPRFGALRARDRKTRAHNPQRRAARGALRTSPRCSRRCTFASILRPLHRLRGMCTKASPSAHPAQPAIASSANAWCLNPHLMQLRFMRGSSSCVSNFHVAPAFLCTGVRRGRSLERC
jgi:hypothetical protein